MRAGIERLIGTGQQAFGVVRDTYQERQDRNALEQYLRAVESVNVLHILQAEPTRQFCEDDGGIMVRETNKGVPLVQVSLQLSEDKEELTIVSNEYGLPSREPDPLRIITITVDGRPQEFSSIRGTTKIIDTEYGGIISESSSSRQELLRTARNTGLARKALWDSVPTSALLVSRVR